MAATELRVAYAPTTPVVPPHCARVSPSIRHLCAQECVPGGRAGVRAPAAPGQRGHRRTRRQENHLAGGGGIPTSGGAADPCHRRRYPPALIILPYVPTCTTSTDTTHISFFPGLHGTGLRWLQEAGLTAEHAEELVRALATCGLLDDGETLPTQAGKPSGSASINQVRFFPLSQARGSVACNAMLFLRVCCGTGGAIPRGTKAGLGSVLLRPGRPHPGFRRRPRPCRRPVDGRCGGPGGRDRERENSSIGESVGTTVRQSGGGLAVDVGAAAGHRCDR